MLDNIDLQIIKILEENARTSFRKIAKKLGMSPMAILKRVKRLEQLGIIKKYTIVLDQDLLGTFCNLCILVRVKPGYDVVKIGKKISDFPETIVVNQIAGDHDLSIIARCRDKNEIGVYLTKINRIEGIERVNSYYVIRTIT